MKRRAVSCAASRHVPLESDIDPALISRGLENGATIRQLYAAIARLPEEQLIVFLLRGVEGMTTLETAEVLGLSEEAVKGRLKRARHSIQEQIAGRV